jgi:NAD(P) transhydrogenase subunit beta
MKITLIHLAYMLASVLFIFGLKRLSSVKQARQGNLIAAAAMLIAIVATLFEVGLLSPWLIVAGMVVGSIIGAWFALTVEMTAMPEMVAIFNGMGGAASLLVALSYYVEKVVETGAKKVSIAVLGLDGFLTLALSIVIGAITLSGSVIAYGKLQGVKWVPSKPLLLPGRHAINGGLVLLTVLFSYLLAGSVTSTFGSVSLLILLTLVTLALGVLLVVGIGGADMPVVISLLNSYSGLAAAMTGFVLQNNLLIISGSLVGASGLILTAIMCKAMNRSLTNVLFGGFGAEDSTAEDSRDYKTIKQTDAEQLAMLLEVARQVVVIPGYGMAVAQAQHAVRELADLLKARGVTVKYAIHPVAGRMPGHMNVLLAEASIPYEELIEMDEINSDFKNTDIAIVLGANDVVNPEALNNPQSPIYGMPILNVHESRTVIVIKRSLSPGFAGIKNPLFEAENSLMFFGDGRKVIEETVREVKELDD